MHKLFNTFKSQKFRALVRNQRKTALICAYHFSKIK